ncbi:hypothetical protein OG432_33955 [Streptomyces sp. NBC_00442]|uniref:hypothetical protein n=1 Tax=Streptomyces sp. NBC_00442 TaxID=2903651 RepID=UPI002E1AA176
MTKETERTGDESADAQEARRAIDAYLSRRAASAQEREGAEYAADREPGTGGPPGRAGGRIGDDIAECVAREAWDAVQDATPAPPDPGAGPAEKTEMSPERAELHRRAVAVARGLRELGYHLDETLLPGPDMAAG